VFTDEIDKEALTRAFDLTKAEPERAERLDGFIWVLLDRHSK